MAGRTPPFQPAVDGSRDALRRPAVAHQPTHGGTGRVVHRRCENSTEFTPLPGLDPQDSARSVLISSRAERQCREFNSLREGGAEGFGAEPRSEGLGMEKRQQLSRPNVDPLRTRSHRRKSVKAWLVACAAALVVGAFQAVAALPAAADTGDALYASASSSNTTTPCTNVGGLLAPSPRHHGSECGHGRHDRPDRRHLHLAIGWVPGRHEQPDLAGRE